LTACNIRTCQSIIVKFDRDVDSVAYSPDGQRMAASTDLQTRVWTTATCTSNACPTITLEGKKAKFSPDGTRLATINFSFEQGHTARVYALNTCHLESCPFVTLRGHTYFINSVGFSLDGHRVVTAADDKSARVWDLDSCSDTICKPAVVLGEHTDTVRAASFSADGTRVVTASGGFNATTWDARIWDLNAGDCTYGRPCPAIILAGHVGWIYGAEFSPAATHVLTSSSDGTARV
jgi:WD40 repeat protein